MLSKFHKRHAKQVSREPLEALGPAIAMEKVK